jgi:two-component system chemotaxis sensor kinase CheA
MSDFLSNEPMLDVFVFETAQNIEQLEKIMLSGEQRQGFAKEDIDEIFRIMHTIKGSASMMSFGAVAALAHRIEDLFFFIRDNPDTAYDGPEIADIVLAAVDHIRGELERIKAGDGEEREAPALIGRIEAALASIRPREPSAPDIAQAEAAPEPGQSVSAANLFRAAFRFQEGCGMENIRAFNLVYQLQERAADIRHRPEDIDSEAGLQGIRKDGFVIYFRTDMSEDDARAFFDHEAFLEDFELQRYEDESRFELESGGSAAADAGAQNAGAARPGQNGAAHQSMISVTVSKLDHLMDMIGELVIAESMVVDNPDLSGLALENFQKAAHQLRKITGELQDLAMSMRMVPLTNTFQKMNRIVRDMSRKFGKDVLLEITGADTEVDKNIIDHISEPLMHLVRNALDHGIEPAEERIAKGKPSRATVRLGALNEGGEIQIFVRDDGKGLNRKKILARGRENGLLTKPEEEMTDREIYHLIFHPGFSTSDTVTEYSGRGVGMDVVLKNIEDLGGRVTIESGEDQGTQFTIHFPMTLAIIEGMNIRVGDSVYTLPITSIKESLKPRAEDIVRDPEGNEMILFRGECCSIIRLHRLYDVPAQAEEITDGIIVMVESREKIIGVFIDELIGENQVVVKALPRYINAITGIAGCTILGDGSISLILDAAGLAA